MVSSERISITMTVKGKQRWHTQQRLLLVALALLMAFAIELTVAPKALACTGTNGMRESLSGCFLKKGYFVQ
jgi:hypothetical protein